MNTTDVTPPADSPDRTTIEHYYDDYSSWYDDERRTGYYELINDLEFELIEPSVPGARALEVGCGTGLILERTAEVAGGTTGVDLSYGMAEFTHRAKGLDTVQASATDLPFPADSHDVVYSFKVLAHVPDIRRALEEIHRVLRPGGIAYLEFYNPRSLKFLANRLVEIARRRRAVFIRYDRLEDIVRHAAGLFAVEGVRGIRIFAPSHHAYTLPILAPLFTWLERRFCDHHLLARLGGYLAVTLRPLEPSN